MTTKLSIKTKTIVYFSNDVDQPRPAEVDLEKVFPGRTLILAAHPDDELGLCAAVLLRIKHSIVVISTDGAPLDEWFWKDWGSPANYAAVRRREAEGVLAGVVGHLTFLNDWAGHEGPIFRDQKLHHALPQAFRCVCEVIERYHPHSLIVPAYEGGHPDHDACSFLGSLVRVHLGLPVWETPLYHRAVDGTLVCQRFRVRNSTELAVALTPDESARRADMAAEYCSQHDILRFVSTPVELYRPQADYDYSQPPHPGKVNYEAWGWPISAAEVCQSFRQCSDLRPQSRPQLTTNSALRQGSPAPS